MHAVHPDQLEKEVWEGFPFYTLVPPVVGRNVEVYELEITHANPHKHEGENQIYIVRTGKGIMRIDDEAQEGGPGWVVHIPTGKMHSLEPLDGSSVVVYSIKHMLQPDVGA